MKRTGVIVGMGQDVDPESAAFFEAKLKKRFPGVTFALSNGPSSVVFEYDPALVRDATSGP